MNFLNENICSVSSTPQSDVETWKRERFGYITGTRWGKIIFSKTEEEKQTLALKICGFIPDEIPEEYKSFAQYGIDNEDKLRKILETQTGQKIHEVGLVKSKINPIFACSVDGVMGDDIVEFKTTKKEIPTNQYNDYSEINISYIWQMQHNMAITGTNKCHFFLYSYTSNLIYYRIVEFDQEIWDYLKIRGIQYYDNYIKPLEFNI